MDRIVFLISVIVSVSFLLLLPHRLWQLSQRRVETRDSWHGHVKAILAVVFYCLQITAELVAPNRFASPLLATASPIAAAGLIFLSRLEHKRSVRPSDLILIYLVSSLVCDVVQLMVPSLQPLDGCTGIVLRTQAVAKSLLIVTESLAKDSTLLDGGQPVPPEEKSSIFGRVFFLWVNPVLVDGYSTRLGSHNLPNIDHALSSEALRAAILRAWTETLSTSLPLILAKSLFTPFLSVILPRLCLLAFRYGQPLLISFAIRFVQSANETQDMGSFVILAAIFVYTGLAISTAVYQHGLNRLQVMIRGTLVGLLHEHSLAAPSELYGDGKVLSLATTEVEALETTAVMFHETWAQALEVIVGTYLLARQVGWLWPVPHVIIIVCSQISRYVAKNLKSRQTAWNFATQKRISMTTAVLGSVKSIKMLGIQDAIEEQILSLRHQELEKAKQVRWMMVIYNASANALGMFAPVSTIVLFAILATLSGRSLDTETAFPTIAILALVTHSANMVMTYVPRAVAAYASFERLQTSLQGARFDSPQEEAPRISSSRHSSSHPEPAISIRNLVVPSNHSGGKNILDGLNMEVLQGMVVACSGPVGGGKTVLVRTILGEIIPLATGMIKLSTRRVAYCAQTPWLPNQTIKQIIYGPAMDLDANPAWYTTVIRACCLEQDLAIVPGGDGTLVGGQGINLSGGQRQRMALARAVFQRCEIVVLDDPFSSLDGRTEEQIVQNLFGPEGLFRTLNTTVFWITNSTHHFEVADYVIILDGNIQEEGHWSQLKVKNHQIAKLIHHDDYDTPHPNEDTRRVTKAAAGNVSDASNANGDLSLYGYYFASAGVANVAFMMACNASCAFFMTFPQYWVKWWTQDEGNNTAFFVTGYALLYLMAWVSTNGIMSSTILRVAPNSGLSLHRRLLETILRAPLFYFSSTDIGVILNHFSQDIQFVDKQLASSMSALATQVFKLLVQVSILSTDQPIITITLPFCAAIVYVIQKVYLRTSRQLRVIELESRSAVYSNLLETTRGVETIRAFGWQREMAAENMRSLDLSQRPWYLLLCLQRWLNIVLDLFVAGVAVGMITLCVVLKGTTTGGQVGVALTVILVTNTTLLRLVESWTNVDISLGAIVRLRNVERDTPQEDGAHHGEDVMVGWPSAGKVKLDNISASYNENSQALINVNLEITPGQTVVICGRTGSGKSSFLLSLLGLLNIQSGTITVDGIDLSQVPKATIRGRCFVTISQDAFFLPDASLRFNIDPSGMVDDDELVGILRRAGLWLHLASGLLSPSGEHTHVEEAEALIGDGICDSDDGSGRLSNEIHDISSTRSGAVLDKPLSLLPTLSGGQTQLLALARGVAQVKAASRTDRPGHFNHPYSDNASPTKPIVLLDEVTSSLDAVTETAVYDMLLDEFTNRGHTAIMVTHKLGAFAARMRPGRDVVVWMNNGRVESVSPTITTPSSPHLV
ncbi:ABC transporter type 1, transmembrane domain-containing protein [Podospora didyma]|uniref:ABC transporter type 1, transmembrane domain-containing protein n=1 Tax=Podospora didyma TaxID=330526 RepID=A0AAE0P7D9_9PEZI|nr:ABC transporter type 1, transmembrane domain-containing protein [Podospora didyma]